MTTLAAFANRNVGPVSIQSMPTTVVQAPDGSFFVGELTGFPFPNGAARVYRVPGAGGPPAVVAEGFTNIIDIVPDSSGGGCFSLCFFLCASVSRWPVRVRE